MRQEGRNMGKKRKMERKRNMGRGRLEERDDEEDNQ